MKIITKKQLVNLYITKNKSLETVAEELLSCRPTIRKLLQRYNIKIRSRNDYAPWNKNLTKETDNRILLYSQKCSKTTKGNKIAWNKNKKMTNEYKIKRWKCYKRGEAHWSYNKSLSEKHKKSLSIAMGGTGIPYEHTEYGSEFDNNLKEQVRFRDKYKCKICGCSQLENGRQLDCHHIDYDKLNNILSNLISLCKICHNKTNVNRKYWISHFCKLVLTK